MDGWKKQWLLNTRGCPSPDTISLPVGSGVRVKGDGIEIAGALWTPQIGYITESNIDRLRFCSTHMDGFDLVIGDKYHGTPRVDVIYPGGEIENRFYGEDMVEIYCVVNDFKRAFESMKKNPILTCCPVCRDTDRYLSDNLYKDLYDACSRYFLKYWYYGTI